MAIVIFDGQFPYNQQGLSSVGRVTVFFCFICLSCGLWFWLFIYLFLLSEGNFILLYLFVGKCEFLRVLFVLSLLKNKMLSFFLPKC